ncbi:MAG TPA: serine/threonine-protein kinase [Kofleriaceae bacterium]|nr:serine/threonine-protein kinase [Kofleriaceae bacterium]
MFVCAECGASQPGPGPCRADGTPMMPIGDDLLLGTTIGAYRVARLLGVGGMGRVYKGVHPTIGSRVAIKVLSRECSDRRDLVARFFSEAKAVNVISHESIVNVLDLATLPDGRPYIVMEYLDGSPLAGIIEHAQRSGMPVPLGGLARLVAEVLDALGAAHAKGIVHRDLKPDNIYVTPAGRAKVLDFGIAKLMQPVGEAASGSATHTGSLLGTPHYMSPEQAAGRPVDARADLYAIGVILFECSTLQKPFIADSLFDLLRKHVEAPPPSPRALRRDMPEALEHIIYTALAKLPDQRFASAHAMSIALQHATMNLPSEQWTPIQPASSSRSAPSGGWNPTPPASWAGGNRPSVAVAPTQTAGQVTRGERGGSKKGLWLALGALVLVGGGITAAVIAGGGKGDKQVVAQGSGSEAAASGSDAWATPGSAARDGVTPPVTPPVEHEAPDPDDDADDGELDAASTEAMDQAFAEAFNNLDPAARAMFPPEVNAALKKYGKWSKIPKAERMKLLAKIAGMTQNLTKSSRDINRALAGDPGSTAPTPPTTPPTTPKTSGGPVAGLDANGWVVSRRFNPSGYNKKNLSVEKYLPTAIAEAKKLVPDAVLFRIDADGVYPDGHADITLAEHGSLDFRFISQKRAKGDPKLPLGAKQEYKCMFRIMFDDEGGWSAPIDGWECKETLIGSPKCTTAQVWKKAIAKGAPANAIAELGYRAWDGKARWYFDIGGTKFSEVFDDDCR